MTAGDPAPWWEGFFETIAWQDVQLGWSALEDPADQAERVIRALSLESGERVLDVPCGDGRLAIELATRGLAVTGVDLTERFLDAGRTKAAGRGVSLDLRAGDMREALGVERFDAALCFWGSFGYFDDPGNRRHAVAVADALRPGGRYLIDTVSAESLDAHLRPRDTFTVNGLTVTMEATMDHDTGRVETTWSFDRTGEPRVVRRSSVRAYSVHELTDLLRDAGFDAFTALDAELSPFGAGADRLWLIATKGGA